MKQTSVFECDKFKMMVVCNEDYRAASFCLSNCWTESIFVSQCDKAADDGSRNRVYAMPEVTFSFGKNQSIKQLPEYDINLHLRNHSAAMLLAMRVFAHLRRYIGKTIEPLCAEEFTRSVLLDSKRTVDVVTYEHHLFCSASPRIPLGGRGCSCKSIEVWLKERDDERRSQTSEQE